jgi:RHS repeat-associated protein
LPFGGTRWESGATPTDFQFTGQRKESGFGLYDFNARYYDPTIGRFVSADTMVPGAGNPQALNRYSYVFNNPLRYVDPSGHDPLDPEWEIQWRTEHCPASNSQCAIPDIARQERLYSIAYAGPKSGSRSWTKADWEYFTANRASVYESTVGRADLHDFVSALDRLAQYYYPSEKSQFVSAIGLLYAGTPYDPSGGNLLNQIRGGVNIQAVNHGMAGFDTTYHSGAENTHHFAGHLLLGYNYPSVLLNFAMTSIRETLQSARQSDAETIADMNMGYRAGDAGIWLRRSGGSIQCFSLYVYAAMRTQGYLSVSCN